MSVESVARWLGRVQRAYLGIGCGVPTDTEVLDVDAGKGGPVVQFPGVVRGESRGIPEGLRHFAATGAARGTRYANALWLACRLHALGAGDTEGIALLEQFAAACTPPMVTASVRHIWADAYSRHPSVAGDDLTRERHTRLLDYETDEYDDLPF